MSVFEPSMFRAYDIRGTYPNQMNEEVAYAAGQAFVKVMGAKNVVVGRDVRDTGVSLQEAMVAGITDAGANAIEVGVISTEMLYFASFYLECDGGMSITASHNPPEWNGIKFIGAGGKAITKNDKLNDIYAAINAQEKNIAPEKGSVSQVELLPAYAEYLKKYTPTDLPEMKIVANTNFGANGRIVDAVTKDLPLEFIRLNWEEDGSFPKGTPDPLLPKNREEICNLLTEVNADFGVAWDADADRCFFYDEKGRFFHGYYITALLISHFLAKEPGKAIVVERRLTWANLDSIKKGNGKLVFSQTGHGFIKAAMRENQAVFGGESSGHYYFGDFAFCDNGLITFLVIADIFGQQIKDGKKVSDLLDYYLENYPISLEERNYITPKAEEIMQKAAEKYQDAEQNHVDGLSVEFPDWRFNLRRSSNEPVMRLNFEAKSQAELVKRQKELTDFIAEFGAKLRDDHA